MTGAMIRGKPRERWGRADCGVAGRWLHLFRAVDGHGQTVDFYLSETLDREADKRLQGFGES
jgi:transposase-like protein